VIVILRCNYEEIQALRQGAASVLGLDGASPCGLPSSAHHRGEVQRFLDRLDGDLSVRTLSEQMELVMAVRTIVECLEAELKSTVVQSHPSDEGAVDAYFDFAHAFAVLSRLDDMGTEMEAMISLMTGQVVTPELARTFQFPD
jgi:hypothetical protein